MLIRQREQVGFSTLGKRRNMVSNEIEFCGHDTGLSGEDSVIDNNSLNYPLNDINPTDNDLDFFENTENKDSNDFLYYGWPEIGNFEDIDGMFRNCDSTLGHGICKEDEISWLPSADVVENISENHDFSKGYSISDSVMTSFWASERSDDDSYMSFVIGPDIADSRDKAILQKNRSERESKENYHGNGAFDHISDLSNEITQLPTEITYDQAFIDVQRQLQHAMKQVDLRTKLCIRDSLYRLARNAEQRHNRSNGSGDEREAQGTNKCISFMDIERHTNPLDRSIAHLLFHRPLDSSTKPSKVQGPIAFPPLLNENYLSESTTASEVEKVPCC